MYSFSGLAEILCPIHTLTYLSISLRIYTRIFSPICTIYLRFIVSPLFFMLYCTLCMFSFVHNFLYFLHFLISILNAGMLFVLFSQIFTLIYSFNVFLPSLFCSTLFFIFFIFIYFIHFALFYHINLFPSSSLLFYLLLNDWFENFSPHFFFLNYILPPPS